MLSPLGGSNNKEVNGVTPPMTAPPPTPGNEPVIPHATEEHEIPPDLTDWERLRSFLHISYLRLADSLLYVIINGLILVIGGSVGLVGFLFIGPFLQMILPRLLKPLRVKEPSLTSSNRPESADSVTNHHPNRGYLPSIVSAGSPDLYEDYSDLITEPSVMQKVVASGLCRRRADGTTSNRRPPFDGKMARLFVHLCALVYEAREVVVGYASQWGLQVESLVIDTAAAYIFFSTEHEFVIVVFRGCSPFDLTEFLMDAMLEKRKPQNDDLPGMIHEAFLNQLSFNPPPDNDDIIEVQDKAISQVQKLDIGELVRIIQEDVMPRLSTPTPYIWFTGHSMGGALATLAISYLVYKDSPLVQSGFVKGCYTFGSPKCGDTEFSGTIAGRCSSAYVVFYRVVNGDDIIPAMPFGGHSTGGLVDPLGQTRPDLKIQSDYKHLGVPVILHYDRLTKIGTDRDLESLIKNVVLWVGEFPVAFMRMLRGQGVSFVAMSQRSVPFVFDHLPSEYDRHMR